MQCKLQNVPESWPTGTKRTVRVSVKGAPAGKACAVTLYRTTPEPEAQLGTDTQPTDVAGNAQFAFEVTLSTEGVNVLHCEATVGPDFDSDSKGTVVE